MSPHTLHKSTIPPVSVTEAADRNIITKLWQVNKEENRKEKRKQVLTGECAGKAARPFGHCGIVVCWWWYRCNLGDWSIVYFRKLKDHFGGSSSSPLFSSLLQGSNLLKGDTLRGWRLWVGGGRLGLVSTWRAARTRTGTARRTSVQDNTTWRNREGWELSLLIFIWVRVHMHSVGESVSVEQHSSFWCRELTWQTRKTLTMLGQQKFDLMNNLENMSQPAQPQCWPGYLCAEFQVLTWLLSTE